LRQQKRALLDRLHQEYTRLKAQWGGDADYDEWFTLPLNNAQLNSVAAYYDLVPAFEQLLKLNGSDLGKFYEAADKLAHEPKAERLRRLRSLGGTAAGSAFLEHGALTAAMGGFGKGRRERAP
jgi:predicted aminopeptidase